MKIKIAVFAIVIVAFFFGLHTRRESTKETLDPICLADHPLFLEFCKKASTEEAQFEKFKRSPVYALFHEAFSFDEGKSIFVDLEKNHPWALESTFLDKIRVLDHYGNPYVFQFEPYGPFSTETVFNLKVAAELKERFGQMQEMHIVEIGGGCGSLCKILHELFTIGRYTIVDLEEKAALTRRYLENLGIHTVEFLLPKQVMPEDCDLLVSTYSFTETNAKWQKKYIKKLISKAKGGYLICNFLPKHYKLKALEKKRLLKKLHALHSNIEILPELPATGKNNCTLIWKEEC